MFQPKWLHTNVCTWWFTRELCICRPTLGFCAQGALMLACIRGFFQASFKTPTSTESDPRTWGCHAVSRAMHRARVTHSPFFFCTWFILMGCGYNPYPLEQSLKWVATLMCSQTFGKWRRSTSIYSIMCFRPTWAA